MGSCLSLCRRPSTDDDHEPLLSRQPEAATSEDHIPPPRSHIDKVADILAALHVGKLPSQDQLNIVLQKALRSQVLTVEADKNTRVLGRKQQYGPLSERGKTLLKDVRELVEAIIQFGMEKNDDDSVQDLIYQNTQLGRTPVAIDLDTAKDTQAADDLNALAKAIPSFKELDHDAHRLSDSVFTLSRILITSSSFRFFLSDILLTFRDLLADVAADVGGLARTIEFKAEAVEQAVRPEETQAKSPGDGLDEAAKQVQDGLKDIGEETKEKWHSMETDAPARLRTTVADRFQKVLAEAQQDPTYKSALHTLTYLFSKYVERVDRASSAVASISASATTVPTPVIATDPHLNRVLTDLRMLLERLASGRSLSPLILHLEHTLRDITNASSPEFQSDLRQFFTDLRSGIERALGEPGFAISGEGHQLAEQLYERAQALMRSNVPWSAEANKVLDEVDVFIQALASDRTTCRIIDVLDKLSAHTADLVQTTAKVAMHRQRVWGEELKADIFGWVLPRALSILKTIPMPRVELKSETLEVVVDALVLSTTTSFLPDQVFVQNWNEVRMEASTAAVEDPYANGSGVQMATRTRVHIDGVRMSTRDIGYYVKRTGLLGGLISWEDNGLMDVDVGKQGAPGQGLSVDVEIETVPADTNADQNPAFLVNDIKVDVRGLHVSIRKSRHWILNKLLLQPLASPVVRRTLRRIIATRIRSGLEHVNERLVAVRAEVKHRAESESNTDEGPSFEEYWKALCVTIGSPPAKAYEDEDSLLVETETQVTLRGVVHNTRTHMNPESASPTTPTETLVAVGIGPQILPGKGGPEPEADSATDQARGSFAEVEGAAEDVAGTAKAVADDALGAAAIARESLENASTRMEAREGVEATKKGWRSRAFDF